MKLTTLFIFTVTFIQPLLPPLQKPTLAPPQITDPEVRWSQWLATELKGEAEAKLPDGSRIDILSTIYATEVEWISNWEQAVGQASYYGIITNKSARIILLRKHENEQLEVNDFLRCKLVCERHTIELRVIDARTGKFEN